MNDFFRNTATNQHDHEHPHDHSHNNRNAGPDVDKDDGNNSHSESTHDDETRNHRHQTEKESKNMNRPIRTSSAPIVAGFAFSMVFFLCSAFPANAFDVFDGKNSNVFAASNFGNGNEDVNRVAHPCQDEAIIRFDNNKAPNFRNQSFDLFGKLEFNGLNKDAFVEADKASLNRFNFGAINGGNPNLDKFEGNAFNGNFYVRLEEVDFFPSYEAKLSGFDDGRFDFNNNWLVANVGRFNIERFNIDNFNRNFQG